MVLLKLKMAFIGYMNGDGSCTQDAVKYHNQLKDQYPDYLQGPVGMYMEARINNTATAQIMSLLERQAMKALFA